MKIINNEIIITRGTYLFCHVLQESKVITVYNVCSVESYIAVRGRVCRVFIYHTYGLKNVVFITQYAIE